MNKWKITAHDQIADAFIITERDLWFIRLLT